MVSQILIVLSEDPVTTKALFAPQALRQVTTQALRSIVDYPPEGGSAVKSAVVICPSPIMTHADTRHLLQVATSTVTGPSASALFVARFLVHTIG